MITKKERKILDDAPEGAEFYLEADSDLRYASYLNADKTKIFVISNYRNKEWVGVGVTDTDEFICLDDMRNKHEPSFEDLAQANAVIEPSKPRTKTEYVKCEFSHAWEAVKAFEDGEKIYIPFSANGGDICDNPVMSCITIASFFEKGQLYRKVEAEITWQDEIDTLLSTEVGGRGYFNIEDDEITFDLRMSHDKFIEMCNLMTSMTDNKQVTK